MTKAEGAIIVSAPSIIVSHCSIIGAEGLMNNAETSIIETEGVIIGAAPVNRASHSIILDPSCPIIDISGLKHPSDKG